MPINTWWESDPTERYWLETTDRNDVGADLHAPKLDNSGVENNPGYVQMLNIRPGDIVFHYEMNIKAITSWSQATGEVWEGQFVWGSHRASSPGEYLRDGWRMNLHGPYPLSDQVTLEDIRFKESAINQIKVDLRQRISGSLYFPYQPYRGQSIRPVQLYVTKFPKAIVALFPSLSAIEENRLPPARQSPPRGGSRQPNIELRQAVEKNAQQAVEEHYRTLGYSVQDVAHMNLGWDVEATSLEETFRIEVKGRSGPVIAAELTPNEYRRMREYDTTFRLCVVINALDPESLYIYDFGWNPRLREWVTSSGQVLIVDEVLGARVRT